VSRRAPRPVALALAPLRDALAPATLLAEVQRVWPEVAGAAVAREATPVAVRGEVLTIACSASVWAQELDLMAPLLLERLDAALGGEGPRRLRCVTGSREETAR
jgi:predicted nucleic acid-binding Zn ribbon protein